MTRKAEIRRQCESLAAEKAKRFGAAAWYECFREVLTAGELTEVLSLWNRLHGTTCFVDAFLLWIRTDEEEQTAALAEDAASYLDEARRAAERYNAIAAKLGWYRRCVVEFGYATNGRTVPGEPDTPENVRRTTCYADGTRHRS